MAVVTKKCYYSNTPKFILFKFYSSAYSQAYPDFSRQPYPGNVMKNPQIHSYKRTHNPHSTPNTVGPSFPLQQENMQHPGKN